MTRVLCIGDSLALPRRGCPYVETWIAKLKRQYPAVDFICNFKGGMLIEDALHYWTNYYQYGDVDIAIVQEGICDCSPRYINDRRLFWKVVMGFLKKIKMTNLFWSMVKAGRRKAYCVYTSPSTYAIQYEKMIKNMLRGGVNYVIAIKIGHGTEAVVSRSEHFNSNVESYNNIINQIQAHYPEKVISIDPLNKVDEDNFVDGYHCSPKGMDAVYRDINRILGRLIQS